ncbi:LemA family protein [Candidatus Woesearchaeota archaeon]|nr:LemA family protein [Candidatus Woesearchaeota archaeon]
MVTWTIIGAIGLAVVVLFVIWIYNSLVKLKLRVENAWSQIDVQLKRRYDLIPNLIEAVKGYMKHEKGVLESVTKARTALLGGSTADKAKASDQISGALKSIFAVAEDYPKLQASENFKQLQEELSGTESKIAYARQFYNDAVMDFNQARQVFPKNIFATLFGYTAKEFFGVEKKERENVKVKFD